jgi:hypothetical protein
MEVTMLTELGKFFLSNDEGEYLLDRGEMNNSDRYHDLNVLNAALSQPFLPGINGVLLRDTVDCNDWEHDLEKLVLPQNGIITYYDILMATLNFVFGRSRGPDRFTLVETIPGLNIVVLNLSMFTP